MEAFDRECAEHVDLARDLIRRTSAWVYDEATGHFGPSKFVGFVSMNFRVYQVAREGQFTVAQGQRRFDGTLTKNAIGRLLNGFYEDKSLHEALKTWATEKVGANPFDGVNSDKWLFARIKAPATGIIDWEGWSSWYPIEKRYLTHFPSSPGVYALCVRAEDNTRRVGIHRCHGVDPDGLLDFGQTVNLRNRLSALFRCLADANQSGHMAGWRYAYLGMKRVFPLERLAVSYLCTKTQEEAKARESSLLLDYAERHYELPPLNFRWEWGRDDDLFTSDGGTCNRLVLTYLCLSNLCRDHTA